ncbi:hypothetical protein VB712_18655 [Spirulina sp. CCNP1310]|uniref:hypothetical protein n=1 Tax=Spirulina sp. CCNP1310 TaxID=3110249 RepID=UPI002B21C209|nr:hypothetical protein [Spirulina sp. CCNP1310]MEA5421249.1 hypothetical protein [Spirulina sp. CCNP1310]
MADPFHFILPTPPPAVGFFAPHALAQEFRREVEYRQDFQAHCQWYRATAQAHQAELQRLRRDVNLFGWFVRRGAD